MASYGPLGTKVEGGVFVQAPDYVSEDDEQAFAQIVSDLATVYTIDSNSNHDDNEEAYDQYSRIAFFAKNMAQRLGIPFGPAKSDDEEGDGDATND